MLYCGVLTMDLKVIGEMSRVESGKQNITIETLIKICEGLEVSLKDFFDFEV